MSKINDKIKQRFDYNNIYYVIQIVALLLIINYFKSRYSLMSYASQYVHPGMDDYWMSTGVHETWMNTHSLWQCIKCSFKDAVGLYKRLNGTFLSMFLTGLTPLTFNENRYHFVFDIAIINMAIGLAVIAYSLLHRRWKMSVINCISVCLIFIIFYIDYAPSANEGIYWWPGIANYNFFRSAPFSQGNIYSILGKA